MARYPCPVCGDPNGFPLWIDKAAPDFCPQDEIFAETGERSVFCVTDCSYAMNKARQRAEWRKALPDAFDESGNMKPNRLGDVLAAWSEKYPRQKIYL
jgi:hypothetical protein